MAIKLREVLLGTVAVPAADLRAGLAAPGQPAGEVPELGVRVMPDAPPSLDPRTGFGRNRAHGEEFDVVTSSGRLPRAAFRLADPDLAGYVVLDFKAFDWLEDDEEVIGHASDPFHRVEIRASSLTVEIGLDGVTLAATNGAQLLYETMLPVRYYIPPADVRLDLMEASTKRRYARTKAWPASGPRRPQRTTGTWRGRTTGHSATPGRSTGW
ncbi:MAG: hypothetical protein JWQ75_902 [Pseudarthrobacter sp.]|nr:hypothetical protein [Pseudarthrobacter sp.]